MNDTQVEPRLGVLEGRLLDHLLEVGPGLLHPTQAEEDLGSVRSGLQEPGLDLQSLLLQGDNRA